jgi:hypothetical protein
MLRPNAIDPLMPNHSQPIVEEVINLEEPLAQKQNIRGNGNQFY